MADLKVRLISSRASGSLAPDVSLRAWQSLVAGRSFSHGHEYKGIKRCSGVRSWIRVDTSGTSQVLEVDKGTIMRRCDLPARDLRLLDPLFVYPSTILGRDRAIVLNLEQIRCIITADEVLLLNSLDNNVLQYVAELQRRLISKNQSDVPGFNWRSPGGQPVSGAFSKYSRDPNFSLKAPMVAAEDVRQCQFSDMDLFSGSSADHLAFEFRALEVALEAACTSLDTQVQPLLPWNALAQETRFRMGNLVCFFVC